MPEDTAATVAQAAEQLSAAEAEFQAAREAKRAANDAYQAADAAHQEFLAEQRRAEASVPPGPDQTIGA